MHDSRFSQPVLNFDLTPILSQLAVLEDGRIDLHLNTWYVWSEFLFLNNALQISLPHLTSNIAKWEGSQFNPEILGSWHLQGESLLLSH